MPPGRQSRSLRPDEASRLKRFQIQRRFTVPQLKLAMDAPFTWQTLQRALQGLPIWEANHQFIVEWMAVHCPAPQAELSFVDLKAAAAGDRDRD